MNTTADIKSTFTNEYSAINRRMEKMFFPHVKKALHQFIQPVIDKLKSDGIEAAKTTASSLLVNKELSDIIEKLYKTVGVKHAQINYSRLLTEKEKSGYAAIETKGFGFNAAWTKFIVDYLRKFLIEKITFEIGNTTKEALLRALTIATIQGWSVQETVDKLEDWPFERYQAATIVRTETNRAANVGAKAQSTTDPYQQTKEWNSAEDNRVRGTNIKDHASHVGLNGVKIDEEDKFKDPRNGDLLDFPGDPNASAASTVNCRCAALYSYKRDINGNLIPKRKTTTVIYPGTIPRRREVLV